MAPSDPKTRPGHLRAQVARVLCRNAPHAFSVTEIAKLLGHSGGAVGNACQALTSRGQAQLAATNPRRYQATSTTVTVAATTPPPPRPGTSPTATVPNQPAPAAQAAPGGPVTSAAPAQPNAIVRPNGQTYRPRSLAGLPDVEALRRLRAAQVPVLLYGPPGTGKTSLIEAAFDDLITVAGDGDTTVADLIGEYTQTASGGYEFQYGPLVTAMTEGRALLIDDATLISPKVLAALYPAMDGRRQIQVKAHKGETITAAPGFYVVAGHNPGVHGAILTQALGSRFSVQIQVGSDYDLAQALRIDGRAVRIARHLAARQQAGDLGWAPQLRELIAFQKISDVLGADTAFANLVGIAPPEDRDLIAEIVTKAVGRPVTALTLGRQI
ncbi:AAA family ATPase [Streptacidiphilus neutrinimicus]|uniref:AAA family ATPase n=1 Tax=Streptacidiphilus neutrinimicus TaxID=105420 RepID=UPI0005A5DECD|nr:AAA family ATPase [Streptacidiphilus neutrinimicus]